MAYQVPVLQTFRCGYTTDPQVYVYVLKQTNVIEALDFYFDGSMTPQTPDTGPLGGISITDLPDGLFPFTWSTSLTGSEITSGSHTLAVKGVTSGATASATYTV